MGLERVVPFEMNPKVYNPSRDILLTGTILPKDYPASRSCLPFVGWCRSRYGDQHRLLEQKPRLTADQAWDVIRQTSRQDLNLRLLPTLQAATSGLTQSDPRRQLVETLTRWDGINLLNDDGKTRQQPCSAILNVWLTRHVEAYRSGCRTYAI